MRARVMDPEGPRLWRTAPYALPALALFVAFFGPFGKVASVACGIAAIGALNILGLVLSAPRKTRSAELVCGPGYVDVTKAGAASQRIHAKDIMGATTARTAQGILLTLQHAKRRRPVTLELTSDADVEKVRHALGIGHGGFGTIAFSTNPDTVFTVATAGRILGGALATLAFVLYVAGVADSALLAVFAQFGLLGTIFGVAGLLSTSRRGSIYMNSDGLRLLTPRGWFALPYEAIEKVETHPRGFVFRIPQPYGTVAVERANVGGPSSDECGVMVAQFEAAAARARGLGPQKQDVTARVDVLRRKGESPRDWLVRLDMAGQLLSSGTGYRGNTLDPEDLWAVLEDPEADADLRAAAARVLRHQQNPQTRVRIDAAVAAVRDPKANRRLRIAIQDDIDGASEELALLDAAERHSARVMHVPTYGGR